jgi:hypothetical protein
MPAVKIDPAAFDIFDDLAERAQVAYLVEMDHCIAEKSAFRLACIRYLASRGWRWFGEEVDPRIGARLDRGNYEPLRDEPWYTSGMLASTAGAAIELDIVMQRDRARLVQDVRAAVPEARWFGFDIGFDDKDYLAAANAADTFEQLNDAMALRERIIHSRVDAFFDAHPGEKVALMAGSLHLAKDDNLVHAPGMTGPGGGKVPSIGHHVAAATEGPVLSFWFLHGEGASASPFVPSGRLRPGKRSFNAELLKRYDEPVVLRVDDDHEERTVTHMHNLDLRCRLSDQVDGIVFAPHVTPLR